jgi:O-antigen ligase
LSGPNVLIACAGALIVAACLLGGASRVNSVRLAAVELCALPLAAAALRRLAWGERRRGATFPVAILLLILAVPVAQLLPLPAALWTLLPGQGARIEALGLAGVRPSWLPMTLAPRETARAALALIPPAAMLLGALGLTPRQLHRLTAIWLLLALGGLILGVAQIAEPNGGPAYLYRTTNLGSLVGWFANRNHEAGFLVALMPLGAALAGQATRRAAAVRGPSRGPWLAGLFIVISLVAVGVIRSRAGVILAAPAAVSVLAVLARGAAGRSRRLMIGGAGAAILVAVMAVVAFGLPPILDRFAGGVGSDLRYETWPYVAAAARTFLPLGSGLGSFDRVFEAVEPLALVAPSYFNHAHNDFLELWLETGVVGAAILALFLVWWGQATARAWRSGGDLARGASLAIPLMLAESLVDYPLRTETMAVLLAFCCGALVVDRRESSGGESAGRRATSRGPRP